MQARCETGSSIDGGILQDPSWKKNNTWENTANSHLYLCGCPSLLCVFAMRLALKEEILATSPSSGDQAVNPKETFKMWVSASQAQELHCIMIPPRASGKSLLTKWKDINDHGPSLWRGLSGLQRKEIIQVHSDSNRYDIDSILLHSQSR